MSGVITSFLAVFLAVFPIVDPLAGGLIFFGMTANATPVIRRRLARRVAIYSFIILNASLFVGAYVLNYFGISLPVLRVAGGLVVAAAGWRMLHARDDYGQTPDQRSSMVVLEQDYFRQAFYPITMPLTTGPGTISVLIALGTGAPGHWYDPAAVPFASGAVLAAAAIAALIYVCYAGSALIRRLIGSGGTEVAIRLTAFILFCIGVQILWDGIETLAHSLMKV